MPFCGLACGRLLVSYFLFPAAFAAENPRGRPKSDRSVEMHRASV